MPRNQLMLPKNFRAQRKKNEQFVLLLLFSSSFGIVFSVLQNDKTIQQDILLLHI